MSERQVLVVASDYQIVKAIRSAVQGRGFSISGAFSHRDTEYLLGQGVYDIVMVDHAMADRHSHQNTLRVLAERQLRPPLIGIGLDDAPLITAEVDATLKSLEPKAVQAVLIHALRIPMLPSTEPLNRDDLSETARQHIDEMQLMFSLARSLSEVLDLTDLLNRLVEAARYLTQAEEAMILLPDEDGQQLWLRAKVGIEQEAARNFRIKTADSLAGAVFQTGQPLNISGQGPLRLKTEYFVKSMLYVPILYRGKAIGVLGVNNRKKDEPFQSRQLELLLSLAAFAAVSMQNARVHEENLRQTRELRALVEASEAINATVQYTRMMPNITDQLIRVLGVTNAEVMEWQPELRQLRTVARAMRVYWRGVTAPTYDLKRYPHWLEALDTLQPVEVTFETASVQEADDLRTRGAQTLWLIPFTLPDTTVGLLFAYYVHEQEAAPSAEIVRKVAQVAGEIFTRPVETRELNTDNPHFKRAREVLKLMSADGVHMGTKLPGEAVLRLQTAVWRATWTSAPYPTLSLTDAADIQQSLEKPAIFQFAAGAEGIPSGARALLRASGSRTILAVPLTNAGKVLGLVMLGDANRPVIYNRREVDLARALSGQVATAMTNATLVRDLQQSLHDLKDAQGRLVYAERLSAMGELAAAVAHQVNNPLTTILVDTELLMLDEPKDTLRYKSLDAIFRAGKRAAGVVRRLLAAARTEPSPQFQAVDVAANVEEVVSLVQAHIERDKMRVISRVPSFDLPPVLAPPGQLDDIWLNLLLNAHDAMVGRPDAMMGIEVGFKPDDSMIEVHVWDNGPGIPAAIVDEIFKPFFTTKPVGEGTGLGLHICRQVVDSIGGEISVQSAPEKGTRFLVRLPIMRGE